MEGARALAHGVQSFAFRSAEPVDPSAFAQFLSLVSSMLGPRLLRLKGLFALADRPETPILVDGVQHVFHAPRALPRMAGRGPRDPGRHHRRGRRGAGRRKPLGRAHARAADRRARSRRADRQSAGAASGRAAGVGVETLGARSDWPLDVRKGQSWKEGKRVRGTSPLFPPPRAEPTPAQFSGLCRCREAFEHAARVACRCSASERTVPGTAADAYRSTVAARALPCAHFRSAPVGAGGSENRAKFCITAVIDSTRIRRKEVN